MRRETTTAKVRVLVVDPHALIRQAVKAALPERYTVIAEEQDAFGAMMASTSLVFDLAIISYLLPDSDGIKFAKILRQERSFLKIIMFSMMDTEDVIAASLQAGVDGFVSKRSADDQLVEAAEAVMAGRRFLCTISAERMALYIQRGASSVLSGREREVLAKIAAGKSNKEIASELALGVNTIKSYRKTLMRKLDARNAAGLVSKALERGLLSDTRAE